MKYTPLDIQRREFEKAFRGLEESEVRTFLHEIAGEWEELLAENQKLKEEILDSRERLHQYQDQDHIRIWIHIHHSHHSRKMRYGTANTSVTRYPTK